MLLGKFFGFLIVNYLTRALNDDTYQDSGQPLTGRAEPVVAETREEARTAHCIHSSRLSVTLLNFLPIANKCLSIFPVVWDSL